MNYNIEHIVFAKNIQNDPKMVCSMGTYQSLTEECSTIIQNKLPPKLSDLGSFSIPCSAGDVTINKALCDLRTSMSLMPYSIYKKVQVGDMKPTTISL